MRAPHPARASLGLDALNRHGTTRSRSGDSPRSTDHPTLFEGVEINLESLRSLITGGIAFATPNDPNDPPAKDGTIFVLRDKPQKEWLDWMPKILIPPAS